MLIRPTLFLEPSSEPLLDLFLHDPARAHVGKALRNLLLDVDVVLDVLKGRVIGKALKQFLYFLFRCAVTTARQVDVCLKLALASSAIVGFVAILQVANVAGVPEFLND